MQQITAKQFQGQKLINQGITQGRVQGAFEIVLNAKKNTRN